MSEPNTNADIFDVFLCHNTEDKSEIRGIARQLAEKGIKPWLDEDQIQPGELWQTALEEQINNIKSAAVFFGESGLGPWQQEEMQSFLGEFVERKCRVIPVILSSATETPDLPWPLKNRHRVDFRSANPDPFMQLIWGITGEKPDEQPIDSLPLVSYNPNSTDKERQLDDLGISGERQYPAIVSPPEGEQRAQLLVLLDRVKEYWVDGVLKHSIYNELFISLDKRTMDQAVEPPWKHSVELPSQRRHPIIQDHKIDSLFDAKGMLLILGEPGSGKTTSLLELASGLIKRTRKDPKERVPIVLNLSSWKKKQTLDEWIVEELSAKYRIPPKIGRNWLKNDYLLPLLDGLDEVNIALQPACVSAINEFINKFEFIDKIGPSGLVVCCRLMEYRWLPERLKLNGAICLELLSSDEVNEFLTDGGSQLAGLRQMMSVDPVLQELSKTPLMLSIMSLAYEGIGGDGLAKQKTGSHEERRKQIFNLYVERMFQRKKLINSSFSKDKVIGWLAQLAKGMKDHSQSVFMVEELQPSWLNTEAQQVAYSTVAAFIFTFIFVLMVGIFVPMTGLIDYWVAPWIGLLAVGPIVALIESYGTELFKEIKLIETLRWQWKEFQNKVIKGLKIGLNFGLFVITCFIFFELPIIQAEGAGDVGTLWLISLLISAVIWVLIRIIKRLHKGLKIGLDFGLLVITCFIFSKLAIGLSEGARDVSILWLISAVILVLIIIIKRLHKGYKIWLYFIWLCLGFLLLILALKEGEYVGRVSMFSGAVILAGLIVGTIIGLFSGMTDAVKVGKSSPNQGINLSLKNSMLSILFFGLIFGLIGTLVFELIPIGREGLYIGLNRGIRIGLYVGLFFGLIGGIYRGGLAVVQHYSLRLILWIKGYTPFRFIDFLDHCAKLILLKKVGGGYIFIHRMLLEYFAKMETSSTKSKKSE